MISIVVSAAYTRITVEGMLTHFLTLEYTLMVSLNQSVNKCFQINFFFCDDKYFFVKIIINMNSILYLRPVKPSCLQTTVASSVEKLGSQTVPH